MPGSSSPASTPFRRLARLSLVVAWAGLIFAASHQPDLRVSSDDLVDLVLRKAAHMLVFGVFAVLVARTLRGEGAALGMSSAGSWLATLAYAASDEWHQTFVAGRAGQPSDVVIDMVGATVALVVLRRRWTTTGSRERAA